MSGHESDQATADFQLAQGYFEAGQTAEATDICHQILAVNPHHPDALHMLGVIAYQAKTYRMAAELLSKAILANPNFPQAHFNLGNVLKEMGESDAAIICYRNALVLNPRDAKSSNNLGDVLQGQGKLAEAIECYRAALEVESDLPKAHYSLGLALQAQGKLELDAMIDHFIAYPQASTAGLRDKFNAILASEPEVYSVHAFSPESIHRKNRIDLFKAECRVDAIGRDRFLARLQKQVDISALSPGKACRIFRFDEPAAGLACVDSRSFRNDRVESLCGRRPPAKQHVVAELDNARLCTFDQGFAAFDADDNFVDNVCWGDGVLFALADRAKLPPLQTFDGVVMPLCGCWGSEYFHWVLEILPRLLLVLQAGYRLEDVDLFLVDRKLPHLMEFLEMLGIQPERVMEWRKLPHVRAQRLLVTTSQTNYDFSRPLSSVLIEPRISQELHRLYAMPCGSRARRRIYIDRENARYRKVANDGAVKGVLARHGFEFFCMESLSLKEKRELFSCAEMVVGPAGAGFSNLVLCNEGTKVLIFYQEEFATDSFWSICNNNGLTHFHLLCQAADEHGSPKSSPPELNDDLLVDVGELEASVTLMIDYMPQPAPIM